MKESLDLRLLRCGLGLAALGVAGALLVGPRHSLSFGLIAPVLILSLFMWSIRRTMVEPISQLLRAARQVRGPANELPYELPVRRDDEIGGLAREVALIAGLSKASAAGYLQCREHFVSLVQAIPDAVLRVDRAGKILESHFPKGWTQPIDSKALAEGGLSRLFPEDTTPTILDAVDKALARKTAQNLEIDFRPETDTNIQRLEIYLAATGEAECVAIIRDLSEAVHSRGAARRLRAIVDETPELVFTINEEGALLEANPAARALLRLSDELPNLFDQGLLPQWALDQLKQSALADAGRHGRWRGQCALIPVGTRREIPVSVTLLANRSDVGERSFSFIASDLRQANAARSGEATQDFDPVTGLPGRGRFVEQLEHELRRSEEFGSSGAVLVMDLDDFKFINESLGHRAGDRLLASLSSVIRSVIRSDDLLAKLGGDEFAVMFSDQSRDRIETVARDLILAVRQHSLVIHDQPMGATASIGVALFPDHGSTAGELLSRADQTMYQAKERGRDQYLFYVPDEQWQASVDSRLSEEKRIRQALRDDDFVLYSQPIKNLSSDEVTHYEVLLRMKNHNGDTISPTSFLSTAERFGLIRAIDQRVTRNAIRTIAEEQRSGRDLKLAVNLSAKSVGDPELLSLVIEELSATRINPSHLIFEITETSVIEDIERALAFTSALKQVGCQLALDDFGVGFSSLSQLRHLPIDYLKIDGSFIKDLPNNRVDQHLVDAIVGMARALGKKTVAEYVGDKKTLELLRAAGVDYAQGYHIGKPTALPTGVPTHHQETAAAGGSRRRRP